MLLPARHCSQVLKADGINIVTSTDLPSKHDKYDVFSWHGVPHPKLLPLMSNMQYEGKKLMWSVDDDYTDLPPWNPITFTPEQMGGYNIACKISDSILCSTDYLASTFKSPHIKKFVTPNMLEVDQYLPFPRHNPSDLTTQTVRILWSGSNTHRGDLENIVEAVSYVIEKYSYAKVDFIFFGECHPELRKRHLYKGVTEVDPQPLGNYHHVLKTITPDIWLCPIDDHKFNYSKSNLKVLEGMALQAAVVASNVGPYKDTIEHGATGFLATTTEDWINAICTYVENPKIRSMAVANGYQHVNDNYNWNNPKCKASWLDMYRNVVKGEC